MVGDSPSFEKTTTETAAESDTKEKQPEAREDREPSIFRCLDIPPEANLEKETQELLETAAQDIDRLMARPASKADRTLSNQPAYKEYPHIVKQAQKAKEAFGVLEDILDGTKFTGSLSVNGAAGESDFDLTRWDRAGKEVTERGFQGVSFSLEPSPESPLDLAGEKVALVRLDIRTGGDDKSIRVNFYGGGKGPGNYRELQSLRIDVHTGRGRPPAVDINSSVFGHLCDTHQEVPSLSKLKEEEYSPIFRLLQDAVVINLEKITEENRSKMVEGQPALKVDKASRRRLESFSAAAKKNLKFPGTEEKPVTEQAEVDPWKRLQSLVVEKIDPQVATELLNALTEEMPTPTVPTEEAERDTVLKYLFSLPHHEPGNLTKVSPQQLENAIEVLSRFDELGEETSEDPVINAVGDKLIARPNADELISQLGRLEQAKNLIEALS